MLEVLLARAVAKAEEQVHWVALAAAPEALAASVADTWAEVVRTSVPGKATMELAAADTVRCLGAWADWHPLAAAREAEHLSERRP